MRRPSELLRDVVVWAILTTADLLSRLKRPPITIKKKGKI